jgi:hypothetical protein
MPTPTIDLAEVATSVTEILNARAHEAQSAQRDAERLAAIRAQREADEAAERARIQRETALRQLAIIENTERGVKCDLDAKTKQYATLGKEINALSVRHNLLLAQLHTVKKQLGLS